MDEINQEVIKAFQRDIVDMMYDEFGERVAIIQDPETEEETLHKISGEDISEDEYYALTYYELGWNSALRSFEKMGESQLEGVLEHYREDLNDDTGRTD